MLPETTKLSRRFLRILYFFVKLDSVNVNVSVNVFQTNAKKKVINKNINLQTQITIVNKYGTLKYMYKRKIFLHYFLKFVCVIYLHMLI